MVYSLKDPNLDLGTTIAAFSQDLWTTSQDVHQSSWPRCGELNRLKTQCTQSGAFCRSNISEWQVSPIHSLKLAGHRRALVISRSLILSSVFINSCSRFKLVFIKVNEEQISPLEREIILICEQWGCNLLVSPLTYSSWLLLLWSIWCSHSCEKMWMGNNLYTKVL